MSDEITVLRAELAAANARAAVAAQHHVRANTAEAERDALQARLDRVTALADEAVYADFGEYHPDGDGTEEIVLGVRESHLRAALNEGKTP